MGKYLTCGNAGWCTFKIGDFEGHASYLTDVPIDFLDSFIDYYETGKFTAIICDEEGSEFLIISDGYRLYIISIRDDTKLYKFEMNIESFIAQIFKDIKKEKDRWNNFLLFSEEKELNKKIARLEELINKEREMIK